MKILIKKGDSTLAWEDAVYKNGWFYSSDETICHYPQNIYSVKDDDRSKKVVCSACGAEIRNTPSAIHAHRNMINKPNKCFECEYKSSVNSVVMSQKYVLNEDGTYAESTKRNVNLVCDRHYRRYDINSENARHCCKYACCENATFKNIEGFWTKYPNAFDEFITIDRIIEDGYKSIYKGNNNIELELKGKAHITALINGQGICCEFMLSYRRNRYMLRYSKKYDKVWAPDYKFKELSQLDISECIRDAIHKKLKTLYE